MTCLQIEKRLECNCTDGYEKHEDGTCKDVDECSLGLHDCPRRSKCVNSVGTFDCQCFPGYNDTLPGHEGKHCINNNLMTCQQTENSLKCSCKDGFNENVNGTCLDIDECALSIHNCSTGLLCVNNDGGFDCKEWLSFLLSVSDYTCQVIISPFTSTKYLCARCTNA